jgi:hypothetical protein
MYTLLNNCVRLDLSYEKIIVSSNYGVNACILFLLCITDFLYILGMEWTRIGEMEEHHILMKKNLFKEKIQVNQTESIKVQFSVRLFEVL